MNRNRMKKLVCIVLCVALVAAMAIFASGCNSSKTESTESTVVTIEDGQSIGQGATQFTLTVVDVEGKEVTAQISTDKATVGEALMELGLVAGEESDFGLMITTVNGITLDFNKDGKYWAFYVDGQYASTGVDQTGITAGATYMLKAE